MFYAAGVSIAVELSELRDKIGEFGWAYLLTVRDDQRPHVVAVTPTWNADSLIVEVGRGTAANALARPTITLCYPPPEPTGFSLVVDGTANVEGHVITFTPVNAVLHRPAPSPT